MVTVAGMEAFLMRRSAVMLVLLLAGCDIHDLRRPQQSSQPATAPASLEERLLGDLDARRQWRTNGVKISLKKPTIALDLSPTPAKQMRVHAWGPNENDFNTAMMRVNEGDVLYAITNTEFEELRSRAAAAKVTPFELTDESATDRLMATEHVVELRRKHPVPLICWVEDSEPGARLLYLGENHSDHTVRVGAYRVTGGGRVWVNADPTLLEDRWSLIK